MTKFRFYACEGAEVIVDQSVWVDSMQFDLREVLADKDVLAAVVNYAKRKELQYAENTIKRLTGDPEEQRP